MFSSISLVFEAKDSFINSIRSLYVSSFRFLLTQNWHGWILTENLVADLQLPNGNWQRGDCSSPNFPDQNCSARGIGRLLNVSQVPPEEIKWRILIHLTFLGTAIFLAWTDKIMYKPVPAKQSVPMA